MANVAEVSLYMALLYACYQQTNTYCNSKSDQQMAHCVCPEVPPAESLTIFSIIAQSKGVGQSQLTLHEQGPPSTVMFVDVLYYL